MRAKQVCASNGASSPWQLCGLRSISFTPSLDHEQLRQTVWKWHGNTRTLPFSPVAYCRTPMLCVRHKLEPHGSCRGGAGTVEVPRGRESALQERLRAYCEMHQCKSSGTESDLLLYRILHQVSLFAETPR